MPRKKPFSVKQKKKQLQDKRERKRGQRGAEAGRALWKDGCPPHRGARERWWARAAREAAERAPAFAQLLP